MGAYYSRNQSYSRSLNAEYAESQNKFPITRAAKHLNITLGAFKKGLEKSNITTNEWHHVGKYANKIDYWDVSDESEICNSLSFMKGARNKNNKDVIDALIKKLIWARLNDKLGCIKVERKSECKRKAFNRRCDELKIYEGNRNYNYVIDKELSTKNLKEMAAIEQRKRHNRHISKTYSLSNRLLNYKNIKKRLKLECDNLFKQSNIISFISGTFIENDYICGYCIKLTNNERLSVMKNKSMLFNHYGSQLDYAVKKCDKYISDVFK